tara:strand:- start:87 stop:407 length:321 start_codon:yes stop_codon:yes gene_type:complete
MSISHRASGVVMSTGTVLVALWLVMLAAGENTFNIAQQFVSHPIGKLVMFGYSMALFYHACNGIRHLFWDAVIGLDIPSIYRTGYLTIFLAILFTLTFWLFIYIAG